MEMLIWRMNSTVCILRAFCYRVWIVLSVINVDIRKYGNILWELTEGIVDKDLFVLFKVMSAVTCCSTVFRGIAYTGLIIKRWKL